MERVTATVSSSVVLLSIALLHVIHFSESAEIVRIEDCVCPRHNVTYRCTLSGDNSQFTQWGGTIMNGDPITLSHDPGYFFMTVFSNNRDFEMSARGVPTPGAENLYTSELTFLVKDQMQGRTINCSAHDGRNVVATDRPATVTLNITTEPYMSPSDVHLAEVSSQVLVFNWSSVTDLNCPTLTYIIDTENCGDCINVTSTTETTCTNFSLPSNCTLSVSSAICSNPFMRSLGSTATATLKVPDAPKLIEVIPYYADNGNFTRVVTTFYAMTAFNITSSIDGSATNYTIMYTDSNGQMCGSSMLPPSSCTLGVCAHVFGRLMLQCIEREKTIYTSIYAMNVLGVGYNTTCNQTFGITNNLFSVKMTSTSSGFNCTFMKEQVAGATRCTCAVTITYDEKCGTLLEEYSSSGPIGPVIVTVIFRSDVQQYCYNARGTCGNKTAVVEGTLNFAMTHSTAFIAVSASTSVIIALLTVIIIEMLAIIIHLIRNEARKNKTPWTIHFSNKHTVGSLADVLKVFKDLHINIIGVNTPWHSGDFSDKQRKPDSLPANCIYFDCEPGQEELIIQSFKENEIKYKSVTGGDTNTKYAELYPEDRPGALWEFLEKFREMGINLRGLNTALMIKEGSYYNNNYVTCKCSPSTVSKIVDRIKKLENCSKNVKHELADEDKPSTTLQVFVQKGLGNLRRILKVFRANNTNITSIHEIVTVDEDSHTQKHYVECICNEEKRGELKAKLDERVEKKTEIKDAPYPIHKDHIVCEFSVKDEIGSLANALKAFMECMIEPIGVNTQHFDKKGLKQVHHLHYLHVTMKCTVSENNDVLKKLQKPGFLRNPVVDGGNITFSIIEGPQVLAEAYQFVGRCVRSIDELTLQRNSNTEKVEYRKYKFVFSCPTVVLRKIESDLNATCLVIAKETKESETIQPSASTQESLV